MKSPTGSVWQELRMLIVSLIILWIVMPLVPRSHPDGRLLLELLIEWGELND